MVIWVNIPSKPEPSHECKEDKSANGSSAILMNQERGFPKWILKGFWRCFAKRLWFLNPLPIVLYPSFLVNERLFFIKISEEPFNIGIYPNICL